MSTPNTPKSTTPIADEALTAEVDGHADAGYAHSDPIEQMTSAVQQLPATVTAIRETMQAKVDEHAKRIDELVAERESINEQIKIARAEHAEAERVVKALTPRAKSS